MLFQPARSPRSHIFGLIVSLPLRVFAVGRFGGTIMEDVDAQPSTRFHCRVTCRSSGGPNMNPPPPLEDRAASSFTTTQSCGDGARSGARLATRVTKSISSASVRARPKLGLAGHGA